MYDHELHDDEEEEEFYEDDNFDVLPKERYLLLLYLNKFMFIKNMIDEVDKLKLK